MLPGTKPSCDITGFLISVILSSIRRYGAAISACDKAVTFVVDMSRFAALGLWDEKQVLAVCTVHWPDTPGIPRVN